MITICIYHTYVGAGFWWAAFELAFWNLGAQVRACLSLCLCLWAWELVCLRVCIFKGLFVLSVCASTSPCLCVHLPLCPYVSVSFWLCVSLSLYLSVSLSLNLSVSCVFLSSILLSLRLSIYVYFCLSIPEFCLFVSLFLRRCYSVSLYPRICVCVSTCWTRDIMLLP